MIANLPEFSATPAASGPAPATGLAPQSKTGVASFPALLEGLAPSRLQERPSEAVAEFTALPGLPVDLPPQTDKEGGPLPLPAAGGGKTVPGIGGGLPCDLPAGGAAKQPVAPALPEPRQRPVEPPFHPRNAPPARSSAEPDAAPLALHGRPVEGDARTTPLAATTVPETSTARVADVRRASLSSPPGRVADMPSVDATQETGEPAKPAPVGATPRPCDPAGAGKVGLELPAQPLPVPSRTPHERGSARAIAQGTTERRTDSPPPDPVGPMPPQGSERGALREGRDLPEPLLRAAYPLPAPSQAPLHSVTPETAPAQVAAPPQPAATVVPQTAGERAQLSAPSPIDAAIEQLAEAREAGRSARPEVTVRHDQFGAISMRIETAGSDLRATLSARDPGFVPAIQAALADRGIASQPDGASHSQRGHDQQSGQQQTHSGSSGHGHHSEPRYGSSTGWGQASSQPYTSHTGSDDEEAAGERQRADPGPREGAARPGGLFA